MQEATRIATEATLKITLWGDKLDDREGGGSGFLLNIPPGQRGKKYDEKRAYMMTASHVLGAWNKKRLKSISQPGNPTTPLVLVTQKDVQFEAENRPRDILLFSVARELLQTKSNGLQLHDLDAHPMREPGHPAAIAGFPGKKYHARPAFLLNMQVPLESLSGFQSTFIEFAASGDLRGNSGGPLVSMRPRHDGKDRTLDVRCLGMVDMQHETTQAGIALDSRHLRKFLDDCEITIPSNLKAGQKPKKTAEPNNAPEQLPLDPPSAVKPGPMQSNKQRDDAPKLNAAEKIELDDFEKRVRELEREVLKLKLDQKYPSLRPETDWEKFLKEKAQQEKDDQAATIADLKERNTESKKIANELEARVKALERKGLLDYIPNYCCVTALAIFAIVGGVIVLGGGKTPASNPPKPQNSK